jgi:hypothetical protein
MKMERVLLLTLVAILFLILVNELYVRRGLLQHMSH